jgi:predicted O-methyltransferase YrrM
LGFKNQKVHSALAYAKYLYKGNSAHSIHSPFVFKLYNEAIKSTKVINLALPESVRSQLLKNENIIELQGFGVGSRNYSLKKIRVKKHAKNSLKGKRECELFYRIVRYLKPQSILELGTSFGVSTLYLSEAVPQALIVTLEGEPDIHCLAKQNFSGKKINAHLGEIDVLLPEILEQQSTLDCVVFDANHSYEATIVYFEQCLEKVHNDSFFIVDDIYWSEGMTCAWEEIKNHSAVKIAIDLYYFGVVFFRKEQPKENFVLRQFQLIP